MTKIVSFTFNPFSENTYVLYDDSGECVIIDPGCNDPEEKAVLYDFVQSHHLKPVRLLNTHCHIDHVLGNKFAAESWMLTLECHAAELKLLQFVPAYGAEMGIVVEPSPLPSRYIEDGEIIRFGQTALQAILAPGHSPGSLCFYCPKEGFLIGGDVLFYGSVGRTDLPGGDWHTLEASIRNKIFTLPDDTVVYPGHDKVTSVGYERKNNPFFQ